MFPVVWDPSTCRFCRFVHRRMMPCRSCEPCLLVMKRVSVRTQLAICGQAVSCACKVCEWARFTVRDAYISGSVWDRRTPQVWASDVGAGGVHGQGPDSSISGHPGALQESGDGFGVCIARRTISLRSSAGRERSGIGRDMGDGDNCSGFALLGERGEAERRGKPPRHGVILGDSNGWESIYINSFLHSELFFFGINHSQVFKGGFFFQHRSLHQGIRTKRDPFRFAVGHTDSVTQIRNGGRRKAT